LVGELKLRVKEDPYLRFVKSNPPPVLKGQQSIQVSFTDALFLEIRSYPTLALLKTLYGAYLEYGNVIVVENIIIGCLDGVNIVEERDDG